MLDLPWNLRSCFSGDRGGRLWEVAGEGSKAMLPDGGEGTLPGLPLKMPQCAPSSLPFCIERVSDEWNLLSTSSAFLGKVPPCDITAHGSSPRHPFSSGSPELTLCCFSSLHGQRANCFQTFFYLGDSTDHLLLINGKTGIEIKMRVWFSPLCSGSPNG